MPPEYVFTCLSAESDRPKASSSSAARSRALGRLWPSRRASSTRFSVPVRSSSTEANWPVRLTLLRTSSASRTMSWPSTLAEPSSGASRVPSMRMVVVLPAPLGPRKPWTTPLRTARSTPSTARSSPNTLTRPEASMARSAVTVSLRWDTGWRAWRAASFEGRMRVPFRRMVPRKPPGAGVDFHSLDVPGRCDSSPGGEIPREVGGGPQVPDEVVEPRRGVQPAGRGHDVDRHAAQALGLDAGGGPPVDRRAPPRQAHEAHGLRPQPRDQPPTRSRPARYSSRVSSAAATVARLTTSVMPRPWSRRARGPGRAAPRPGPRRGPPARTGSPGGRSPRRRRPRTGWG